ncbi:alpha/beta hydrolase [Paenibacillus chondroitinus]|uniref:Alpha/beta hydrolase n=1 Tax=Paenibacillus chondroitinus TaxID=59842 RepID=A0ABU6DJ04_9BACL|nr:MULTISPECIES: alpha/beta hydrolase [Paenibacillus]MCY9662016.1 alpha/beta hydrolase [Paenibacillus anseongense]MEB4797619.1 alpha/beta hydrolase [Paenibacillus chondroitinus]
MSGTKFKARKIARLLTVALILLPVSLATYKQNVATATEPTFISATSESGSNDNQDEELVKTLPGFQNGTKSVNGIKLHYVEGGKGEPLFLLPGWPETWYEYRKIMPELAKHYHVYSIDIRGMGSSDKPTTGYDKKTMASDIYALMNELGYKNIYIAGHDIGSTVAYAFAANYPHATKKLAMLDISHPDNNMLKLPLVAPSGSYDESNPARVKFPWWWAFNAVPNLPEQLLHGKNLDIAYNWAYDYLSYDKPALTPQEKAIYLAAYAKPDALRAANDWFRTFRQDIDDFNTYKKLSMPVLGIYGSTGISDLGPFLKENTRNPKVVELKKTGHWIAEEQPEEVIKQFKEFFR